MEIESRKVSDSIVETVHMVRPQHLNASDRLFGGALMQWIDEVKEFLNLKVKLAVWWQNVTQEEM